MPATRSHRYQEGSIDRVKRANGPDMSVYRWRDLKKDGTRVQRKKTIGDIKRFPTKSDVQREVENLRAKINAREELIGKMTIRELWGHFQAEELRCSHADRSPTTIECYLENFKRYILPEWGDHYLDKVKAVGIEKWLSSLSYAPATKAKLRNQMSCLYSHAIRHEHWKGVNPIASVRQSSKRVSIPDILTLQEMQAILGRLTDPMHRIAVLIAAVTGLRRSEIMGLKWSDFEFDRLWLRLERGIVKRMQTKLKGINPDIGLVTWTTNAGRFGHLLDIPRNMPARLNLLFDAPDLELPPPPPDHVRIRGGDFAGNEGTWAGLIGQRRFAGGVHLEAGAVRLPDGSVVAVPIGDLERFV